MFPEGQRHAACPLDRPGDETRRACSAMAGFPGSTGLAGPLHPVAHRPQPPCRALLRMADGLVSDERSEDHAPSDLRGHPSRCERSRSAHRQKAVVRVGPRSRVRGTPQDRTGCKGRFRDASRSRPGDCDPVGLTSRVDTMARPSQPSRRTATCGIRVRFSNRRSLLRTPLRIGRFSSARHARSTPSASGGPSVMPANRRTPWLLCYDIADPRRLQRVHRVVCRHAVPLQYSVFHTIATRHEVLDMLHDIEEHIAPREDDVRAYPLLTTAWPVTLGRGRLASGIMLCHSVDTGLLHGFRQLGHTSQDGSTPISRHCFNAENSDMAFQPQT